MKIKPDHIGITSSILCLIHCLALPVIFATMSIIGEANGVDHHHHDHSHSGFNWDYVFAVIAIIAAYFAIRKTCKVWIKTLLAIGAVLFSVGVLLHNYGDWYYLMHSGSVILIGTHIANLIIHRGTCAIEHKY